MSNSARCSVARFTDLALGEILLGVFDGFLQHALDLGVVNAIARLDLDRMLIAGTEILRCDLQDAVGVNQEFYFDAQKAGMRGEYIEFAARDCAARLVIEARTENQFNLAATAKALA